MTYFGVITPVFSAVLSVFMMGLAAGTYVAGRISRHTTPRGSFLLYACIECCIGLYAFNVPALFRWGHTLLLDAAPGQSGSYLALSGIIIGVILFPVCTLIGATFPFLMNALRRCPDSGHNFSYLYLANLIGAIAGCVLPLALIEILGFQASIEAVVALNGFAALLALTALPRNTEGLTETPSPADNAPERKALPGRAIVALFLFGFVTLGSEVVWMRAFTPLLGPTVYAYGYLLLCYLFFNTAGTWFYLYRRKTGIFFTWVTALLPLFALIVAMSGVSRFLPPCLLIIPLCFALGGLTPKIVDDTCGSDARLAATAYMCNFLGCILGPLFTTYLLFPYAGIKGSLVLYAALLIPPALWLLPSARMQIYCCVGFAVMLVSVLLTPDIEDYIAQNGKLYRDHVGYIGALYSGQKKNLTVNGVGMTYFTTVTKNMAYLPLSMHPAPRSALTICVGMGTTLRALSHWPLERITAVELSRGVIEALPYFHSDIGQVLADPRVKLVNDDGRRYLERTHELYDVIIIDPPPPVDASGSGLLYTDEFLRALKSRLAPGGILQHWAFDTDSHKVFMSAVVNAIRRNFHYIRLYQSIDPFIPGLHIIASDSPLPALSANTYAQKLPPAAARDLQEWQKGQPLSEIAQASLNEVAPEAVVSPKLDSVYMSDDRLYNEFYVLRRLGWLHPGN